MALNLVKAGPYTVTLLEKGPQIASHIQDHWSHVNLFSPNSLNMSPTGEAILLEQSGGAINLIPDSADYSSGGQFVLSYLKPLETYLQHSKKCDIRFNTTVMSVGRKDAPKHKQVADRSSQSFLLLCSQSAGMSQAEEDVAEDEYYLEADVGELAFCFVKQFPLVPY